MALRSGLAADDVEVLAERRPYTDYFSLIEQDLRFRRFDGGMSGAVTRAGLVSGDAATLLPYDPEADAVLLIEQFRFGPLGAGRPAAVDARADRRPPRPGREPRGGGAPRGDGGGGARDRPHREGRGLLPVDRAPSASTSSPSSALCDLSGRHGGVSAARAAEDEDILSHVVPFDRLMQLVASGEAENGPLLLSALWLAANRDRLRGG